MPRKETTLKTPVIPAFKATIQPADFDAMPDGAYIREAGLVASPKRPGAPVPLPFSAPTLWRKVRELTFPAPVRLSGRVTAWKVGEVRAWLTAQEAQVYAPAPATAKRPERAALVQA
jgi:prophage regulatory protein